MKQLKIYVYLIVFNIQVISAMEIFPLTLQDKDEEEKKELTDDKVLLFHFFPLSCVHKILQYGIKYNPTASIHKCFRYINPTQIKPYTKYGQGRLWQKKKLYRQGNNRINNIKLLAVAIAVNPKNIFVYNAYFRKKEINQEYTKGRQKEDYIKSGQSLETYIERIEQNNKLDIPEDTIALLIDPKSAEKYPTCCPRIAQINEYIYYRNETVIERDVLPTEFVSWS